MSTYNTGNPVPSIDPRDLDDNAKILDQFANSTFDTYSDRLGVQRRTLFSIQHDADSSLLRSDLSAPSGATRVGFQSAASGSVPTTLAKKAERIYDAVLDAGADPTGTVNSSTALLNFYTYCLNTGTRGNIPAGNFLVTPGVLNFSGAWADKSFPHIVTAGHRATIFTVASDVNAPMLRINNGTATAAQFNLWRGGSHGGITFVDPFPASAATGRHGLAIYGFGGTKFGYMKGQGLRGDLLRIERKLFTGNNPDPYNVSFCEFEGIESNASLGYGINNDNTVGLTHCRFKFVRVVDGAGGGIRGLGVSSEYVHVSMGNQKGWAVDAPFDLLIGGRTTIRLLELDNVEKGYNIESISGLDILESRVVHRFQTAPNVAAVYWPTTSYNISSSALIVTSLNIKGLHRTQTGGTLAAIGQFVNCNNSVNVRGCKIDLDVSDNGALGILDTQLVTGLNANSVDVIVTSRGKKVANTSTIIGCSTTGTTAVVVGNTGYLTETAKLIFPTESYDRGNFYDPATGFFTVPFDGLYKFSAAIVLTLAASTRVRIGVAFKRSAAITMIGSRPRYAPTANIESYEVAGEWPLIAGDQVFLMADQGTAGGVNLGALNSVAAENQFSVYLVNPS